MTGPDPHRIIPATIAGLSPAEAAAEIERLRTENALLRGMLDGWRADLARRLGEAERLALPARIRRDANPGDGNTGDASQNALARHLYGDTP